MKKNKNILRTFFSIVIFLFFQNFSFSQGTYFNDADFVYLRNGFPGYPLDESTDKRTLYWDLSSIDTSNNRLDLCVGLNEIHSGFPDDYVFGNWFKNSNNSNFNYEQQFEIY